MRQVGGESVEGVEKDDRPDVEQTHSQALRKTRSSPVQPDEREAPQQRDVQEDTDDDTIVLFPIVLIYLVRAFFVRFKIANCIIYLRVGPVFNIAFGLVICQHKALSSVHLVSGKWFVLQVRTGQDRLHRISHFIFSPARKVASSCVKHRLVEESRELRFPVPRERRRDPGELPQPSNRAR